MDTVKYELKLFLDDASGVELEEFIPVFHDWIQTQQLAELLIDVADYRHVPQGPGIALIAHDAHYVMDLTDARLGLLYSRRRETHPSQLLLRCNDRLRAPNTTAAYDELCQHLAPFLATLYPGQRVEVEHIRENTSRLTVAIKVPEPLGVDALLTRLA